ncbi:angiogenic factor with G patch and FHA domains 1-like isoform X2 [Dreissena polymorpha]|uniref:angiogenic factor with G patch and FHA domains 1-like isoform X2 n=1 Tax=Dreissena polymorpha TaxID=45954 RepID=UPI0022642926|nr:angiogenic factor with G patch and FHA domains 1-like isoform X2 [Dreissena polymorpha]
MARKSDEELLCMIKSTAEGSSITTVTSYAVEVGFSEDSHSEKKENFNTDIADLNVKLKSTFEVNPSTDEQSCTNYEQGVSGDTRKESVSLEETVGKKLKAEQKIKMAGCEDKCDSHKNLQVHTSTSGEREKTHTLQQNTAITMERDNKMEYHIEKTVIGDVNESDIESSECESDGSSDFHLLSKSELVHSLQECRTELSITKKKLEATLRLLKKSDDYNEVMRKMVEQLSSNIHNSKHRHMVSEGVQVDTEHLLNLSSVILPKWSDDNLKAASKATDHTMAVDQQAESNACTLSIAESIKQAAESVIQQQEQDEQEAMLKRTGYVFDPTSSQYYHPETGYYYDPKTTLFYDPSSGCYYYFNYEKGEYVFHAQVETQSSSSFQQHSFASENAPQTHKNRRERKKLEEHQHADDHEEKEKGELSEDYLKERRRSRNRHSMRTNEKQWRNQHSGYFELQSRSRSSSNSKQRKKRRKHKSKSKKRHRKHRKSDDANSDVERVDQSNHCEAKMDIDDENKDLDMGTQDNSKEETDINDSQPNTDNKCEELSTDIKVEDLSEDDNKKCHKRRHSKIGSKSKHKKKKHSKRKKGHARKDDNIGIESGECCDNSLELEDVSEDSSLDSELEDNYCYEGHEMAPQLEQQGSRTTVPVYDEYITSHGEEFSIVAPGLTMGTQENAELASSWPPCIRMIVTTSDSLSVGTLFIVPCTGSVIGREKCDVIIPDLNVSKEHATISYNEQSRQYEIVDNASQNGTIVNGTRISMPKVMSDPVVLSHGSNIWIAGTQLLCHIHSGTVTCDNCEPGIVMSRHQSSQNQELKVLTKEAKKLRQRQEMNEIKKKYGLKNSKYVDDRKVFNKPEYEDKAALRRKHVASDTSDYKSSAPSSVHRPISNDNIGHKLLAKMGWKEGESLGKDNSGIQEPINVTLRANQNAGLGSFGAGGFSMDDVASTDLTKASRRVQAQQRFNKIDSNGDGKGGKQGALMTWTKGDTQFSND